MGHEALIGYSGFVGSHLARQHSFSHYYRSTDTHRIDGEHFDLVVCAGVSSAKWIANKDPTSDWKAIERLLVHLERVTATHFVLISTVDVYPIPIDVDEDTEPSESNHAYGHHRLSVERFVVERFQHRTIIRLPGLFGTGLKKNILYDLLQHRLLDQINPASEFQYYDLSLLWSDVERIRHYGLPLVNIATEPLSTGEIIERYFRSVQTGASPVAQVHYRVKTKYDRLFGGAQGYLYSKEIILAHLGHFIHSYHHAPCCL